MIDAALHATLALIVPELQLTCDDPWCLIGSAAAQLMGADVAPADVDVLVSPGDAERLIATGSLSIERPAGMVTARLRGPVWRYHGGGAWPRRPGLDIEAIPADDPGRRAWSHGPMVAKYRNRSNLINEIVLKLSLYLACLDDDE